MHLLLQVNVFSPDVNVNKVEFWEVCAGGVFQFLE